MGAEGDSEANVFLFAGYAEFAPFGAGGDDHGARVEKFAAFHDDALARALRGRRDLLDPPVLEDVDGIRGDMLVELGRELRALRVRNRDHVLNALGLGQLAAELLRDDRGSQTLADTVDRGRGARRAGADHCDVKLAETRRRGHGCAFAEGFLESSEQVD